MSFLPAARPQKGVGTIIQRGRSSQAYFISPLAKPPNVPAWIEDFPGSKRSESISFDAEVRGQIHAQITNEMAVHRLPSSTLPSPILTVFASPEREAVGATDLKKGMLLSGDQIVDYALAGSDNMLAPHESRITNLQSKRISRTGISGFVTRSSIAAMAATPISLQGW